MKKQTAFLVECQSTPRFTVREATQSAIAGKGLYAGTVLMETDNAKEARAFAKGNNLSLQNY